MTETGNNFYDVKLTGPQFDFIASEAIFPAMVAGYGAGKTFAGIFRALKLKFDYPSLNIAYYLPTYDLISQIAFPRFSEILEDTGLPYKLNRADKIITILGASQIIFRTMDMPERIVGYEVSDSIVDELDTLKIDKAGEVWRKIVARNRQKKPDKKPNTIGVVTTPEGFRFVYENWKRKPFNGTELIKASTYSNIKNLPDGYIDQLKNTYPEQMLAAYLDGDFVNLTQGSVYNEFDREFNSCNVVEEPGETLHIGMDFNVGEMAASIHVKRDGHVYVVNELVQLLDTPAMIAQIKKLYVDIDTPHKIIVYPDASGRSRKSVNATESDIALLREAKFLVLANKRNPFVRDRIAAVNKMIYNNGERRYKVNIDKCPFLTEGLEKQAYDKHGEPDKTSGLDHIVDSTGYFISYVYPVARNIAQKTKLKGL